MTFVPINHFTAIDAKNLDVFTADLTHFVHEAAAAQGDAAFGYPRSAALVHEAAHTILYTAMGIAVKSTSVKMKAGIATGETLADGPSWIVNETTSTSNDFKCACVQIAGLIGEMAFDTANFRAGSSLDELVLTRQIAAGIEWKSGQPFESVMNAILGTVAEILRQNAEAVRSVARELDHHGAIRRKRLAALLASVQPWIPTP